MKNIDPTQYNLSSRVDLRQDRSGGLLIIIDRKSRIIMKDGEKIRSNVDIIKNNFNLPVELHTSAPVCSKTRIYLEKEDIKVKSLGAK